MVADRLADLADDSRLGLLALPLRRQFQGVNHQHIIRERSIHNEGINGADGADRSGVVSLHLTERVTHICDVEPVVHGTRPVHVPELNLPDFNLFVRILKPSLHAHAGLPTANAAR